MSTPYIYLFGIELPVYGLLSVAGALLAAGVCLLRNRAARFRLPVDEILSVALCGAAGLFVGMKLLYAITMIPLVVRNFSAMVQNGDLLGVLFGGSVFYGGLLGGLLGGYIYLKIKKHDIGLYGDLTAPSIPLFHAIARLGCLFAGCCHGIECESFGIVYEASIGAPLGVRLFPVQLLESAFNLALFAFLLLSEKCRKPGRTISIYLLIYATGRFFIEFLRGDNIRGHLWLLSTSQWISLAIIVVVSVRLVLRNRREKQKQQASPAPEKIE